MSRVGARRECEGVVPRTTGVPRLAKPARHARYAREVDPFRVTAPQFRPAFTPARQQARRAGAGCRGYLVCRAGFAGRDTPLAQAIERYNSLSGPDPRCISGRPLAWWRRCPAHEAELAAGARSVAAIRAVAGAARRAGTERRDATRRG